MEDLILRNKLYSGNYVTTRLAPGCGQELGQELAIQQSHEQEILDPRSSCAVYSATGVRLVVTS